MQVELKTLTPVHIGSGTTLNRNLHFVTDSGVLYVLDEAKIFEAISLERLNAWVNSIEKGESISEFFKSTGLSFNPNLLSTLAIPFRNKDGLINELKTCIKTALNGAFIPGSSLKGAMRTLLVREKLVNRETQEDEFASREDKFGKKKIVFSDKKLETNLFGATANDKPWRILKVGDVTLNCETEVQEINILNLQGRDYDYKSEKLLVECIPANSKGTLKIKLDKVLYDLNTGGRNPQFKSLSLVNKSLPDFFKILNKHTLELLTKEIEDWEDEDSEFEGVEYMVETYKEIKKVAEQCEKLGGCVIRIGAHVGWRFTTGAWLLHKNVHMKDDTWYALQKDIRKKDYNSDVLTPKTRKTTPNGNLLGFVHLSIPKS